MLEEKKKKSVDEQERKARREADFAVK